MTHTIDNWEIFESGTWNGGEWTDKDLDDIVTGFNATKKSLKPYLKLGHDNNQALIQKDGLPSAGWVTALKRSGKKILATVEGIPDKIKSLIDTKAYGRVSSEIFKNISIGDKTHRRALKAVALLGGNTPAVGSLNDFIDLYKLNDDYIVYEDEREFETVEFTNEKDGKQMSEVTIDKKEYQALQKDASLFALEVKKATDLEASIAEFGIKVQELEVANAELAEFKQKYVDTEKKLFETEVDNFVDTVLKDEKITKYEGDFYKTIAKRSSEDFGLVKSQLDGIAEKADFAKTGTVSAPIESKTDDEKLMDKTNEIVSEFGLSYKDAQIKAYAELNGGSK